MAYRNSQGEGANFVFRCYGTYAESCNCVENVYPNLIHLTCLAHVLQHVAEEVKAKLPQMNKLNLMTKKKVFLKAPYRVQSYKQHLQHAPLPPNQCQRCGSWIEAVNF
jgi:hypothetical protein